MLVELLSALCLVAVLEGLFLFVAPRGWRQAVEQLHRLPDRGLRLLGGVFVALGLVSLFLVRGF
ncbi:DUF2065 domain-containing protein [Lysobacter solisilvae (ex Woo and Kim 2020)]|uniref:DUF2065 family protein n=1 Tax=Agrilutibacter terrestris TaxID=2865112 RepID=A0A7H0FVJ6_9GAMM|nr:DUF2065 family protein [Lysobacter terrestris]QNP40062.1 DUF2065 family protein [Lysobacter terrestris]